MSQTARSLSFFLCCTLLTGCKLVDQRSFDRNAGRRPMAHVVAAPVVPVVSVPPLYMVHAEQPDAEWQAGLRQAVEAALARKPNALFTVENIVPASSSSAVEASALSHAASVTGKNVAEAVIADGAQASQVEMTAVADKTTHRPEVRIYVR